MSWGKIKLDKADTIFSKVVRALANHRCERCGGTTGLQASHYFGRAKESTRFDLANVSCLCAGCHQYLGSTDREAYREFQIRKLGEEGYKKLVIRAYTSGKKDRKLQFLYWNEAFKRLENALATKKPSQSVSDVLKSLRATWG